MKLKDYFLKLKTQGKITSEDFDKFVETSPDFEVPDVVSNLIEANFLTRERAMADKDINGKIFAQALNGVDATIKTFYPNLPEKDRALIDTEVNTYEKLKKLDAAYKKRLEEIKVSDPLKEEQYQKNIKELTDKFELVKGEKEKLAADQEKAIQSVIDKSQKELKSYKIKTDLTGRLAQIELAKEFTEHPKVKTNTFNTILGEILKNELDYDQDGNIVVQEIDNGVAKPKFNGNDPVTIDKLLEAEVNPYLKKNNAEEQHHENTIVTKVNGTHKKTLRQMQIEADSL